ncbi:MAG TPA: bifunctional 4-hydroxy-2-oxoglutarate aldolase/2-dehydro-3-deoxy-phosphogluconate aldolase, partial [Trebonia sp.]|nr:bifunctional 4-hydroxy-2-oxoglutarate aldolase/2-dehydro-3-deoxy-phosphogluconate aldolase [Trebonia sp.]
MGFLEELRAARLVAIVRGTDPDASLASALALAEEGVTLIEVSLTTPSALNVIGRARAALGPGAWLGAGTVLSAADADAADAAGASFVVTPALGPGVDAAVARGLPVVAGALTPTEVAAATAAGAAAVKLFPASSGGIRYLRALREPFPGTPFVPVGGVDRDMAREYLAAGAVAVGVGSPLLGDAASGGPLAALRERARSSRAITGPATGRERGPSSGPAARLWPYCAAPARSGWAAHSSFPSPAPKRTSRSGWPAWATRRAGAAGSAPTNW